jgi:hypothetical protein
VKQTDLRHADYSALGQLLLPSPFLTSTTLLTLLTSSNLYSTLICVGLSYKP